MDYILPFVVGVLAWAIGVAVWLLLALVVMPDVSQTLDAVETIRAILETPTP